MNAAHRLTNLLLGIDAGGEIDRIAATVRSQVLGQLRRKGAVVGISGGIDSAVVAALCVRALGADRVLGLFMPERDSGGESLELGRLLAGRLGIRTEVDDVAPALQAVGCYDRQDDAIRTAVPSYGPGWRCKLVLPSLLAGDRLNVTRLTVAAPDGTTETVRLTSAAYLQLVAATNFKQRMRAMVEYYHADRLRYAVAGTPNKLEYDQGFFVKYGDGAADIKPIAHLYKTQVYALAAELEVPDEIRSRPPTTDTFSLPQTQEEFYFALPYDRMDLCLAALDAGVPAEEVAVEIGLEAGQVQRVYADIEAKRRAATYLHLEPLLVDAVRLGG